MVRILNISEGSTIAMHAALLLSKGPGKPITTNDAAETMKVSAAPPLQGVPEAAKAGIVHAVRGPKGGYLLGRPLSEIRLLDVLEAVEGPMKLSRCLMTTPRCGDDGCMLGGLLENINTQVLQHFEKHFPRSRESSAAKYETPAHSGGGLYFLLAAISAARSRSARSCCPAARRG